MAVTLGLETGHDSSHGTPTLHSTVRQHVHQRVLTITLSTTPCVKI